MCLAAALSNSDLASLISRSQARTFLITERVTFRWERKTAQHGNEVRGQVLNARRPHCLRVTQTEALGVGFPNGAVSCIVSGEDVCQFVSHRYPHLVGSDAVKCGNLNYILNAVTDPPIIDADAVDTWLTDAIKQLCGAELFALLLV